MRQIQKYVELINDGDWKMYLDVDELQGINKRESKDYAWATIVRHLDTAQQKIDAEPASAKRWADLSGQRTQRVEDLLDELRHAGV